MNDQFAAEFMELREQQKLEERRLRWLLSEVQKAQSEHRSAEALMKSIDAAQLESEAIEFRIREFTRQAEQATTQS